ncbi:MAG: hypothetical protein Q4C47_06585 [Planctomycetia bacterium]|nr:hypothetical protein [Planctomycetia bacterium]
MSRSGRVSGTSGASRDLRTTSGDDEIRASLTPPDGGRTVQNR